MKTKFALLGLLLTLSVAWVGNPLVGDPDTSAQDAAEMMARGSPPPDPYRLIDGQTYLVRGPGFNDWFGTHDPRQWERYHKRKVLNDGWFVFLGTVIEVQREGIRVRGESSLFGTNAEQITFFVVNYPYVVGEGEKISNHVAREAGTYTYNTVSGGSATLRKLDYGLVCGPPVAPPPTPEEAAAARAEQERKHEENKIKVLKYDQETADKGDSYSQRRMGERFRDGDGVTKDLVKARHWLSLAADQHDADAQKELADLDATASTH